MDGFIRSHFFIILGLGSEAGERLFDIRFDTDKSLAEKYKQSRYMARSLLSVLLKPERQIDGCHGKTSPARL